MSFSKDLDVRITDSSLRDGSHPKRHAFTSAEVARVVTALDAAGVPAIEGSHGDGLSGSSFAYGRSAVDERELIATAVEHASSAKIAALMLPGVAVKDDIAAAALATRHSLSGSGSFQCRLALPIPAILPNR